MTAFRTNAKNLFELDLALLEINEVSGGQAEYISRSLIDLNDSAKARLYSDVVGRLLQRCAYVDSTVSLDGSPDLPSDWYRWRHDFKRPELADHSTHNIFPFEGKMLPQLAHALINICLGQKDKGLVADPFCGSGTVVLEAALMGYDVYGCDIDPVAVYLTKTKLARTRDGFAEYLKRLPPVARVGDAETLNRSWQALHVQKEVATYVDQCSAAKIDVGCDAIVTSPPYFNAIDYLTRHAPIAKYLDFEEHKTELERLSIGVGSTVEQYEQDIKNVCHSMADVLCPGGRVAIIIGDHQAVPSSGWYELYLKAEGLKLYEKMVRPYSRPTRSFYDEVVLIMEKPR